MYSMISYWLKFYRHECGLTQQQVADRLKIERSTYTYYETGKTKPDIGTLIKIAKVFNINYTQLLQGVEDELEDAVADIPAVLQMKTLRSIALMQPQNMKLSFSLLSVTSLLNREKKL